MPLADALEITSESDVAIQAWIDGRNIPGGEVLHYFAQAIRMNWCWLAKAQDVIKFFYTQPVAVEIAATLDHVINSHDKDKLLNMLNDGLPVDLVCRNEQSLLGMAIAHHWPEGVDTLLSWGASVYQHF